MRILSVNVTALTKDRLVPVIEEAERLRAGVIALQEVRNEGQPRWTNGVLRPRGWAAAFGPPPPRDAAGLRLRPGGVALLWHLEEGPAGGEACAILAMAVDAAMCEESATANGRAPRQAPEEGGAEGGAAPAQMRGGVAPPPAGAEEAESRPEECREGGSAGCRIRRGAAGVDLEHDSLPPAADAGVLGSRAHAAGAALARGGGA